MPDRGCTNQQTNLNVNVNANEMCGKSEREHERTWTLTISIDFVAGLKVTCHSRHQAQQIQMSKKRMIMLRLHTGRIMRAGGKSTTAQSRTTTNRQTLTVKLIYAHIHIFTHTRMNVCKFFFCKFALDAVWHLFCKYKNVTPSRASVRLCVCVRMCVYPNVNATHIFWEQHLRAVAFFCFSALWKK